MDFNEISESERHAIIKWHENKIKEIIDICYETTNDVVDIFTA